MSVSSIALDQASGSVSLRSSLRQAGKDFEQLFQSLQNGNLSAAQQAYASFQQVQAGLASSSTAPTGSATAASNPVTADWSSLGQALQSGSLSSAQSALGQLQQDAQAAWQSRLQQQTQNAQSVYALIQGAQGSPVTASAAALSTNSQSTAGAVQNDLSALSQALQTGDTAGAQKLLAQLEQDLQASNQAAGQTFGGHNRHHHHHGVSGVNGSSASAGASTTPSTGTSNTGSTTAPANSTAATATA